MLKIIIILVISISSFFLSAKTVLADSRVAATSAQLKKTTRQNDYRVRILRTYLSQHKSPLVDYAETFVFYADKYNLDWRLVPAITGVESTFGKRIPRNSYNAYGWANGAYNFKSWEDSIEIVTQTLREKYIEKGAPSIAKIARRYAPPSSTWAKKVKYLMRKIEPLPVTFTLEG
ncbi:MAG: hypothetical protein ACOYT7_01200 [Patescibacteria group bacterium]